MNYGRSLLPSIFAGLAVVVVPLFAAVSMGDDKVTFEDHVKPILREKCLSCHNTNKKSSDLDLTIIIFDNFDSEFVELKKIKKILHRKPYYEDI